LRQFGETNSEELFARIAFNIAISNSDDHWRNTSAFWDGEKLKLTPAYDLSPGNRSGETLTLANAISRDGKRTANLATLFAAAYQYGLTNAKAKSIINDVVDGIYNNWQDAADFGRLTKTERDYFWRRQILNPAIFYDYAA